MTRALVLGSTGFVGSCLARKLSDVVAWASREPVPPEVFRSVDVVYNCVGDSRMYHAETHADESLKANVLPTVSALCGLKRSGGDAVFVHVSSSAAGGATVYGQHKAWADWHVHHSGLSYRIVYPGSIFGPGAKKGPVLDAVRGEPYRFYKPEDELVLSYIDDVARAMIDGSEVVVWHLRVSNLLERLLRCSPRDRLDEQLTITRKAVSQ